MKCLNIAKIKKLLKLNVSVAQVTEVFYFNNLINLIYFQVVLKLFKKHSTSFKDVQVFFLKDLKSNFFFGGFGFGGGTGFWGGTKGLTFWATGGVWGRELL